MRTRTFAGGLMLALCALGAWGCGQGPVFVDSVSVDPNGWSSLDTVKLSFSVEHPEHRHDLQFGLRHGDDYPYSNLYLFVQLRYPNGKTLTDTLECPLASPEGRWHGNGGRWIDQRIGYKQQVAFPMAGEYALEVVHAMRKDPLPSVAEVRFALFDRELE